MTNEEIIEGNKLIAEFMGGGYKTVYWGGEPVEQFCLPDKFDGSVGDCLRFLEYHSSWDWLMPAIRKIRDYLQNIERPSRNHCCKGDMLEVDVQCHLLELDIEKTFSSLLPLIEWYNKEQNDKRSVATMQ